MLLKYETLNLKKKGRQLSGHDYAMSQLSLQSNYLVFLPTRVKCSLDLDFRVLKM